MSVSKSAIPSLQIIIGSSQPPIMNPDEPPHGPWNSQLKAVVSDVHDSALGRAADFKHILDAVDSLRGRTADEIRASVMDHLQALRKQAFDTQDLNHSLVNLETGSLPIHLRRIYNHYSSKTTAPKNIVLHQKVCEQFDYNVWNLGDPLLSPLRNGWEPHGPVDPVNPHPTLWPRGQNRRQQPGSIPDIHTKSVRNEIAKKGVDAVLRDWASQNPVLWDQPPIGVSDDPELWADGFSKVEEMVDGVHMTLIDDGSYEIPMSESDPDKPLPSQKPPAGWQDDGFYSPIQYVRQRWCPELKTYTKLRIIGNDYQRNELTSPLTFRLQFRTHRELSFIVAYGLDANFRYPVITDKADLMEDIKREKAARDSGTAPTSRWWNITPKPRLKPKPSRLPSVTLSEGEVDLLGAFFQNGVKRPWFNKQRAWYGHTSKPRWVKIASFCFSFGNRWSCPGFCATIHVIELLLNSWGIPISFYIDDGIIFACVGLDDFFVWVVLEVLSLFGWAVSTKTGGVIRGAINKPIDVLGLDHMTYISNGQPHFSVTIPQQKRDALAKLVSCLLSDMIEAEAKSHDDVISLNVLDFQRVVGTIGFFTWNSSSRPELVALKSLWDIFADWNRCTFKGAKPISFRVSKAECLYMRNCLSLACDKVLSKKACDSFSRDDLSRERLVAMTDASKSGSKVGFGGVITDGQGWTEVFNLEIDNHMLSSMHIGVLEIFAVLIFLIIWGVHLYQRKCNVTFLVDNIGAVFALAKWNCSWLVEAILVGIINAAWSRLQCRVWYTWISTHRNPADDPSRLTGAYLLSVVGPSVTIVPKAVVVAACQSASDQFKSAVFSWNPLLLDSNGIPANKRLDPPPRQNRAKHQSRGPKSC